MAVTRKRKGPARYYAGLTRKQANQREREIKKFGAIHWKDSAAYKGFKTDKLVKSKPSSYTERWRRLFPDATSLEAKAKATGVPLPILKTVYNRGMAAWRTGHRPGATEQQWGYARIHSLLLKGKTYYTADADIVRKAIKESPSAKKWFSNNY
jgi:hypothetical protein